MHAIHRLLLTLVSISGINLLPGMLFCTAAYGEEADVSRLPPTATQKVDFARDIQPLFESRCYSCHGPEKSRGSLRLDIKSLALRGGDYYAPDIIPGKSAESPLIQFVAHLVPDMKMPPEGKPLTPEEIGLMRAWIDQGAQWPEQESDADKLTTQHWSLQPLRQPAVPEVKGENVLSNPVDAFVTDKLTAAGLTMSSAADRTTFIRRIYFDMLGLPPSWQEIQDFVADREVNACEKLVERVLASPRYGERWARHWLDVVRFAETNGFETNVERPNAWHYRDYVIDAFNTDKPYDRFVFEQIAGDAVRADAATGFLVGGPFDLVKSPDPVLSTMQRADELADITNTTATTFLALTVGCARCHNHKFDPILQKDYYAMQAVFAGVQHGERPIDSGETSPDVKKQAETVQMRLEDLKRELDQLRPAARGRTVMLDDETMLTDEAGVAGVSLLASKEGHGINPAGTARGFRSDAGDFDRYPNRSGGRYTWWQNKAGADYISYRPGLRGKYRIWLSWGCGFETHTKDAKYLLDLDGDLATPGDQQLIATINQQEFANGEAANSLQPLWSGFRSAAVHPLQPQSVILLRGGDTGSAITADVIVFEDVLNATESNSDGEPLQPPLRQPVNSRENVERFAPVAAKFVRFTSLATNNGSEPCLDELETYTSAIASHPARNVALSTAGAKSSTSGNYQGNPAHKLEHLNDGKYGNSYSWISNTAGKGQVQVEFAEAVLIDRVAWGRDRTGGYTDRTASEYVIEAALEPGNWFVVASSRDRLPMASTPNATGTHLEFFGISKSRGARAKELSLEISGLEKQYNQLTAKPMAYAGRFVAPPATHRLHRGDPMQPREVVAPNCISVLGSLQLPEKSTEQQRRVALANSLIDPANPLTARVMVNRVWQHHFGTGLVDTPSDFGVNGTRPSHAELLDFLARYLVQEGWSLKKLHRLILLSNTYRQANLPQEAGLRVDAQCRLLWRYPPHRLEAEAIRDAMLATSDSLDLRMGGPGWSTFKPNSNYVRVYDPKDEFGPQDWRRAIYMTKVRMRQDGVFGTFDCPDAGQIAPKRARSTTALQALSLFNSQFTLQQADRFAARIVSQAGPEIQNQARTAFELALGRKPDPQELASAAALIEKHGLPALCRAIYNSNEFLFLP